MLSTIALSLLALALGVVGGRLFFPRRLVFPSILNGDFADGLVGWTPIPDDTPREDADSLEEQWPDPTVHGASVEAPIGHSTSPVLVIGHLNGRDGPAGAGARQTFECGSSPANWCTVMFEAQFSAAGGESAAVCITNRNAGKVVRATIPSGQPLVMPSGSPPPDDF